MREPGTPGAPEFPPGVDLPPAGVSRRRFLELMAASAALAGFSGCSPPRERIVPYGRRPPEVTPGKPVSYATSMVLDGYATGLLVQAREGRPVKVEGNPDHPASLGAAGVHEQASVLDLYDPHRGRGIRRDRRAASWEELREVFGAPRTDGGEGLRFLLEPTASPLRRRLIERIRERLPRAGFTFYSPLADRAPLDAARAVFGRPVVPRYHFRGAEVVVSVGSDFAASGPFHLRYARRFATTRKLETLDGEIGRFYAAEDAPTPTGSLADEHLLVRRSRMDELLAALHAELGGRLGGGSDGSGRGIELPEEARAWVRAAAADLAHHRGRCLVVPGEGLGPAAYAHAFLINDLLGNAGDTVVYGEPAVLEAGEPSHELSRLAAELEGGAVDTLIVVEGNPVYTAPADVDLAGLLTRVPETLYLGLHRDETAAACRGYVAAAHYLEAWGDARAWDGTASPIQPLIRPLYDGRTADELLALFAGLGERSGHLLLREHWRQERGGGDFEAFWEESLQRGVFPDTYGEPIPVAAADPGSIEPLAGWQQAVRSRPTEPGEPEELELVFRPDPGLHDGRFANNAWLQELPDPASKLTWANAVLLAPRTARRLGVETGDLVELVLPPPPGAPADAERSVRAPVLALPGHVEGAATVHLGYGRTVIEGPGAGVGFDAYRLRSSRHPFVAPGARLRRLFEPPRKVEGKPREEHGPPLTRRLARSQLHYQLEGREIALHATLDELRKHPERTGKHRGEVETLYEGPPLTAENQWAMTVDLAACTGCSACVVACQAENNVPVVGEDGVREGRLMHWLRVDHYRAGTPERPEVVHQPMLCQHCEHAPCEYVCPVNATVHSSDGLNEMVYNRCIGTRFCSNNCPYKVRRFNWLDYNQRRSDTESLVLNPDVTVRERGVMEKCTYCVQRIRRAERGAELAGRPLADGEMVTACQQACPTEAIVFGSISDPASRVSKSRENPRMYAVLHELGTRPRTRYLAKVTNPSPRLHHPREPGAGAGGYGEAGEAGEES